MNDLEQELSTKIQIILFKLKFKPHASNNSLFLIRIFRFDSKYEEIQ